MDSKIILSKNIKVDRQYNNVLNFTEQQMLNLCNQNVVASKNKYSFIKQNESVMVGIDFDKCLQSNYMAFQNPTYSNKWFFAWIDDVKFISSGNTEISFTIDAWSTWFGDWTRKACFVNRQHVNDDTIGLNTIPENIDVGEVIEEEGTKDAIYTTEYGYWVALSTNWLIADGSDGNELTESSKGKQYDGITVYNNTVFGNQLVLFKITAVEAFVNIALYLLRTNADGHIADVKDMFIVPNLAVNELYVDYHEASVGGHDFEFYTLPFSDTAKKFNTTITKRHSFTGISVKNNKCFCYPYNYLLVSNNQGSQNIYKYEDFSTNDCVFENQFVMSIGGSGRLVPKNYKGMPTADDEALPLGKYPTCGWSSDAYINWLTQNAVSIPTRITNLVMGGGSSIISNSMYNNANPLDASSSNYDKQLANRNLMNMNAGISTGMSIANGIASIIGDFRSAKLAPNIEGGQAVGDVIFTVDRNCFTFHEMRSKDEYIKIIDDYFTRFGYKCNRVLIPNFTGRRNFNYVEIGASEEIGYGAVPTVYMNVINNACRRGITIWHNHENLGDFSVDNSIVN